MSKSKGNVLDPIDMIDGISLEDLLEKRTGNMMQPQLAEKIAKATRKEFAEGIAAHGTDALRFTLAALASNGRDINWDMKRLEGYRNFCNKLWNASRFVLTNEKLDLPHNGVVEYSVADEWIQSEFDRAVKAFRVALSQFRFDLCANIIYEFTWNQFCDWYLEFTKPVFASGDQSKISGASHTLIDVLEKLLRLAHPIIPFITEEIWQKVKGFAGVKGESIMLQPFPNEEDAINEYAENSINWLKDVIVAVRNIRAECNIPPSKGLDLLFRNISADEQKILENRPHFYKPWRS